MYNSTVKFDSIAATTNAVANTVNNFVGIAAPGSTNRLRIYAITAAMDTTSTGRVQLRIRQGTAGNFLGFLGLNNDGNSINFGITGVPLATNSPLQIYDVGSAVSLNYRVSYIYSIEVIP